MDEFTLYIGIAAVLVVLIAAISYFGQKKTKVDSPRPAPNVAQAQQQRPDAGPRPRRGQQPQNVRARQRQAAVAAAAARRREDKEDDEENPPPEAEETGRESLFSEGRVGAKKLAKLEAKAERKAQRENEERLREEKKKQQKKDEEERERQLAKTKQEEDLKREAELKEQEERERQMEEEYQRMRAEFSVEDEGCQANEEEERQDLLQEFISYVKNSKVVLLDELAGKFKLKTQEAIDRLQYLVAEGQLTGVIDDRGKFIYISQQELEAVAQFIRQRGRVSLRELVESSNTLIRIVPQQPVETAT